MTVVDASARDLASAAVACARELRGRGARRFEELGWPTRRDEAWRYTDVSALTAVEWRDAASAEPGALTRERLRSFEIPDLDAVDLVFVDGRFRPELSDDVAQLGPGVSCGVMPELGGELLRAIEGRIGLLTAETDDAFVALNNSRAGESGVVLVVAAGAAARKPVRVLAVASDRTPIAWHPRHVVIAGRGARATILEHSVALASDAVSLNNSVTEVFAADSAFVEHYQLEQDSEEAFNISTLAARLEARSDVHSHTVLLGGRLVRNNVAPTLAGEDAHCLINGLYVGHGEQHLDNVMRVRHSAPNCRSRQYYKGILADRSRGLFTGRIIVDPVAQKTDAIQSNRNMLMSDEARATARPQLEIYADDVRCTHGATTGRVNDEALFYFRSRGIAEEVARAMLVYAFAAEGFGRMGLAPVRRMLAAEMIAKLPGAAGLSIEIE